MSLYPRGLPRTPSLWFNSEGLILLLQVCRFVPSRNLRFPSRSPLGVSSVLSRVLQTRVHPFPFSTPVSVPLTDSTPDPPSESRLLIPGDRLELPPGVSSRKPSGCPGEGRIPRLTPTFPPVRGNWKRSGFSVPVTRGSSDP